MSTPRQSTQNAILMAECAIGVNGRGVGLTSGRGPRVALLLAAIVGMALGDLWLTLTHLHAGGMYEANGFARAVMAFGSPWLLAAWKLATVALGIGLLTALRRRGSAEVAAWILCGVHAWVILLWSSYTDVMLRYGSQLSPEGVSGDRTGWWMMMGG